MSQTDLNVANAPGAAVRADLNAHLDAIATNHSGASAPATTFANMWWFDAANNLLKVRNHGNTAWLVVASKSGSVWLPAINGDLFGTTDALDELGLELVSKAEAEAGVGTTARRWTAERVAQAIAAQAPSVAGLTRVYGTGITLDPWATNQNLSQAHGLSAYPDGVEAYLECLATEDQGWAAGDRLALQGMGSTPCSVVVDATTVFLRTSAATIPIVTNKDTGAVASITAASWKAVVTPYKYV